MTTENFKRIEDALNEMTLDELVPVWNEYCDDTNRYDNNIFPMDEFDEVMGGQTPTWIADRINYGNFNSNHDYFGFNGYGNLVSFEWITDKSCTISTYDLADWLADNQDRAEDYLPQDFCDLLKECTEDESVDAE